MAEVFLARHPHGSLDMMGNHEDPTPSATLVTQTSGLAPPEPNPPFVFPGFQDPATMQETQRLQSADTNASAGSRPAAGRSRPKNLSINALPAFEFGAGSETSASTRGPSPSPTRSPARRTPPAHHPSGHRRGGSEFVGGDVAHPITAGVSPAKSEDMSLLSSKPSGPPIAGRRGHVHRRSGAVSQHDLSMILKPASLTPASDNRAGSAPTTPSDLSFQFSRPSQPELDRSFSQPASTYFTETTTPSPPRPDNGPSRARVTFSSDPEFIPRPLSTISSDTSSSMSTARANHSVNDSITSVVSGGTSSPPYSKIARFGSGSMDGGAPRHRTRMSGSLPRTIEQDQWSWDPEGSRATSAPLNETKPKQHHLSEFAPSPASEEPSKTQDDLAQSPPSERPSPYSESSNLVRTMESRPQSFPTPSSPVIRPRTSPEPKIAKRQKKVKSWAGSILSRKAKNQMDQAEISRHNTPTPQPETLDTPPDSAFSLDDVTFDEDTTCIIETPRSYPTKPLKQSDDYSTWNPRNTDLSMDDASPMLDIDAALGSFDRPGHSSSSCESGSGFGRRERRMHSSGETGGFSGPGMHYHRRAESAPELDFFDQGRLGFPHRGSNPAMAEAIEEEEEDEEEQGAKVITETRGQTEAQELGLGVNIVESGHTNIESIRRRTRRAGDAHHEIDSVSPKTVFPEPQHYLGGVEIVGADEEPRFSVVTKSSDGSTITPTLSPEPLAPNSAPLDFASQPPSLLHTSDSASAISSPDYTKTSFDNQDPPRIHTATSSITDRATLSSSRTGENTQGSVDDVPSLTSSASTMISGHPTRFSSSANTTASFADRASSLSAAVPARTRSGSSSKRNSLASLSRLVGSSYNKSKLNIAEMAPPDSPERSEKKKGKRISRLMFWKSREKLTSS